MSKLILIHTPCLLVIHNCYLDLTSNDYYHLFVSLDHIQLQMYISIRNYSISHFVVVWLWVVWNGEKKISRPYRLQCSSYNLHPSLSNFMMCRLQIFFHCLPKSQWGWVLCWDSCHPMISSWISDQFPCRFCSTQQVSLQSTSQGKLHACSYRSKYLKEQVWMKTL